MAFRYISTTVYISSPSANPRNHLKWFYSLFISKELFIYQFFQACAVGTDVAILAPNFDRVQIIPGQETENGEIASSVSCCTDTGKVSS